MTYYFERDYERRPIVCVAHLPIFQPTLRD